MTATNARRAPVETVSSARNATRTTVSAFGVLAGLAGVEHGVGGVLQGSVDPDGIVFETWLGSEDGPVLILLSVLMFLVGGGIGPPAIGVLGGVAGPGIHAPRPRPREHLPISVRGPIAAVYPLLFGVCAINGTFLVVGSGALVCLPGLNAPDSFVDSFFAVVSLLVVVFAGVSYDLQRIGRDVVTRA